MSQDEMVTINAYTHIPRKFGKALLTKMDVFDEALKNSDYLEAAKAIGVLEFIGQTDIDYFVGMMYQRIALELMGYSMDAFHVIADPRVDAYTAKAIEHFTRIPKYSDFYSASVAAIEAGYRVLGDYEHLDRLLRNNDLGLSPIEELSRRIECLENLALINPAGRDGWPARVDMRRVEHGCEDDAERFAKFKIFDSFANALSMAAECISQVSEYSKNVTNCGTRFEEYQETATFAAIYDKCICVLRCCDLIDESILPEGMTDLPQIALNNRSWSQRIEEYRPGNWKERLLRFCSILCAPEQHPGVDSYQCVESILRSCISLGQYDLSPVVSKYFSVIVDAAENGSESAQGYLGFMHSMIRVDGNDRRGLEDKLSGYSVQAGEGFHGLVLQQAKLANALTRHCFDALINAECAFALHESGNLAVRDASHIALMYFRVLEMEYNDSLIRPFIDAIDYSVLENLTGYIEHASRRRTDEPIAESYKRWLRDLDSIYAVKTGFKKSMEIGVIRTLLAHIHHWSDQCAHLLEDSLESVLTTDGVDAYRTEKMIDVIGRARVEEYRNPGAHTGFVTLTKANEAREFVISWAPIVETWFKATERRA